MKPVLIIQNIWDDPVGSIGDLLTTNGIPYEVVKAEQGNIPDPHNYGALIVLGGAQNANEDDKYPYLTLEKVRIRQAVEQEIPFLGICLGGQLLATVLNAQVSRHTLTEIGFSDVQLTEEGRRDPLYARLSDSQCVYQWHEDTFAIPQGAVRLATNVQTENQAFRFGKNAYALQYHIELTEAMLDTWLHYPSLQQEVIEVLGQDGYNQLEQNSHLYYPIYHEHTRIMLENFLNIAGYSVQN